MSDLHLKSNLTKDESFAHILYHLFRVFGDKNYAVRGWGNKIVGYGIKQAVFEKFKKEKYSVNERIFRERKNELLDRIFIEKFYKSKHMKGRPYYKITPIGLFYMLSKLEIYEKNTITDIFKVLDLQTSNDKKMMFDSKLWKYFTTDQIHKALKQLTHFSDFTLGLNETSFSLDLFLFASKNRLRVYQIRINSEQIQLEKTVFTDLDKVPSIINKELLYSQFSLYISMLLCYYLFKNMKSPELIQKTPYPFRNFIGAVSHTIETELERDIENNSVEMVEAFGWE